MVATLDEALRLQSSIDGRVFCLPLSAPDGVECGCCGLCNPYNVKQACCVPINLIGAVLFVPWVLVGFPMYCCCCRSPTVSAAFELRAA